MNKVYFINVLIKRLNINENFKKLILHRFRRLHRPIIKQSLLNTTEST